ncbi:Endocytosis and vacuole integrity protein [Malassezia vespertilionis]|uniref:Uncharacterized protein n=1 Tax=Malassezia vespertilionis TaxID=2020962 RepID=A0A2N1J9N1_9BASI|nr:Endocytosis and vacuole integrity protein [Malassezia vespertilionis]PKI83256.1 hypothetical protein MVES_002958 [Malassezia vespertilionis]WFD07748.1 Endocytosis and vacuole integrity protein [Malassezia vespertilionis]
MPQRIVSELQALLAETRRKHPDVRQACEAALKQISLDDPAKALETLTSSEPIQQELVDAVVAGCGTRTSKVALNALSLLHRCVMLHVIPTASLGTIIETLHGLPHLRADVDVQFKILQTVSALLVAYPQISSNLLSRTLMLCFVQYEHARVPVVSSTAAATLRQNIMTIFDKILQEDHIFDQLEGGNEDAAAAAPPAVYTAQTPDGPVTLFPFTRDAYFVFSDLCALANGEPASFLQLSTLPKPFVLELLESVLTNHARLFSARTATNAPRHPELLYILRSAMCPLLLKVLSDPPAFSVYVRTMRLILLLLRQFSEELVLEIEILLRMVLSTAQPDKNVLLWHRVLALEVLRSLCADGYFMRRVWRWYDAGPRDKPRVPVFAHLVETLRDAARDAASQLATNPSLAAARDQMPATPRQSMDTYTLYGAASAAVAGVRNAAEGLLSVRTESFTAQSVPPTQLLDQLDKTEPPTAGSAQLPILYPASLVLWAHVLLAQSLAYTVVRQYAEVYADTLTAPPAMEAHGTELAAVYGMLRMGARPLNESMNFFLTVQSTDYLFEQTLLAVTNLAKATGMLALDKERDLVLATLSDLAVPASALGGQPVEARNLACQAALADVAVALAGSLHARWRSLLRCLLQALALLRTESWAQEISAPNVRPMQPVPPGGLADEVHGRAVLTTLAPAALEPRAMRAKLGCVFAYAVRLDHAAYIEFVEILAQFLVDAVRRSSTSKEYVTVILHEMQHVALRDLARMKAPDDAQGALADAPAWTAFSASLFTAMEGAETPQAYRLQAASVLDTVLEALLRAHPSEQRTVFASLAKQSIADHRATMTDVSIRKAGIDLLQSILAAHAHRLQHTWDLVFFMCRAAAQDAPQMHAQGTSPVPLLKAAFSCVRFVCTDHLAALTDAELILCIESLPSFSMQEEDMNIALASNGVLWDITADVHRRQLHSKSGVPDMWFFFLQCMRTVTGVAVADVRNSAIANLFQVLIQYNASLPPQEWPRIFSEILFPLLDELNTQVQRDEGASLSAILAFQGTAKILRAALERNMGDDAPRIWRMLLDRMYDAYVQAPPNVAQVALDAMAVLFQTHALQQAALWRAAWAVWVKMGAARKDATLANLVTVVGMLGALYPCLLAEPRAEQVDELIGTLEICVQRGIAISDVPNAKLLLRLMDGAQSALLRLPSCDTTPALVLQSLGRYVGYALEAIDQTLRSPPLYRLRFQLAKQLLARWQEGYLARPSDAQLYGAPVFEMLHTLCTPLRAINAADEAPHVAMLASEVLYHIAHLGTHIVVATLPDRALYWRRLLACFSVALHAYTQWITRDADDAEQASCVRLLHALEYDVLPVLGADPPGYEALDLCLSSMVDATHHTTHPGFGTVRERCVYWTFDTLFSMCRIQNDASVGHRLVAVLVVPRVLDRTKGIMNAYLSDHRVSGAMPFPRVRIEEMNYTLYNLLHTRLFRGCLFLALRTSDPMEINDALHDVQTHANVCAAPLASPTGHVVYLAEQLEAAAAMRPTASATTQKGAIGTSVAPLARSHFAHDIPHALLERFTQPPTLHTDPATLAHAFSRLLRAAVLAQASREPGTIVHLLLRWRTWLADVPGPPSRSFVLGNLPDLMERDMVPVFLDWRSKYGDAIRVWGMFGEPRLLLTDPVGLDHVFKKRPYVYPKVQIVRDLLGSLMGNGLLLAEGDVHRRQKRAIQPGFAPRAVRNVTSAFDRYAHKLGDLLQQHCERNACIDMLPMLSSATLDALGTAALGVEFRTLDGMQAASDGNAYATHPLTASFTHVLTIAMQTSVARNVLDALSMHFPCLRSLPIGTKSSAFLEETNKLFVLADEIVANAKAAARSGADGATRPDIFSSLLRANTNTALSKEEQHTILDRTTLTDPELAAQISTFIFAGHETTATQLTWLFLMLAENQAAQETLRAEIRTYRTSLGLDPVPGTGENARDLTAEELDALPYLDWCIREALRLQPAIHTTSRSATELDFIPLSNGGSVRMEKDTLVLIPIAAISQAPVLWGSDPHKFRPERWAEPLEGARLFPAMGGLAFLQGARGCIGARFAVAEMKSFVSILANRFLFASDHRRIIPKRWVVSRPFDMQTQRVGCKLRVARAP